MIQGRWAETLLIPLSHPRCRQDSPLHGSDDLLSIGPLFGHRSISKFAIELTNRLLNDSCFDFVDHSAPEVDIRLRRLTLTASASRFNEVARMFVRLDYVASVIVNADHCI